MPIERFLLTEIENLETEKKSTVHFRFDNGILIVK